MGVESTSGQVSRFFFLVSLVWACNEAVPVLCCRMMSLNEGW